MENLEHSLDQQLVTFLDVSSRDEALHALTQLAQKQGLVKDADAFVGALLDRENVVSTGIGMGVAVPHAKLAGFTEFFIAIGILSKGVDWEALDSTPVRLIFMIGGPDDRQTEYLQILSQLTGALHDDHRRKRLLNTRDPEEVISLLLEPPSQ